MKYAILEEIRKNPNLKVISFDIFDTLLFRTAKNPKDVFGMMYDECTPIFPEYTDADDWMNVRQRAEWEARQEKFRLSQNYEVNLEDIYEKVPFVYTYKRELRQLELECECKACFLNQEIYSLLVYIKDVLKLKIILTSDMYLSSGEISNILVRNGFDINLIDKMYVSCEYKKSKRYVELYEQILTDYTIDPQEMFHIGDNYYSDVCVPNYLGMPHFHYNLISEAEYRYPFLRLEELVYGEICKEIYSLRLIAANQAEDHNFWFQMGAMILGPFLTFAADWVVEQAEKNHIKNIRPLMREGKFLSEMIGRAAAEKKSSISVEPLYVSRMAVFTALFENITEKEIKYLFATYNIALIDVFKLLKIEDLGLRYQLYWNKKTVELRDESNGDMSIYDEVLEFLISEDVCKEIRKRNAGSTVRFEKYLKQMGLTEGIITVDIGWRGSIQNAISTLLYEKDYNVTAMHLLYISRPEVFHNLTNKCDVRGFVGNFGSEKEMTENPFARLYEMFLLCEDGTTVNYEIQDNKVVPVLRYIDYPQWQTDAMKKLQEGVIKYQECYYALGKKKPHIKNWKRMNVSAQCLIERLLSFPLKKEAEKLKNLVYDQNFGSNSFTPIIDESTLRDFFAETVEDYYGHFHGTAIVWKSGLNALKDPLFYYRQCFYLHRKYNNLTMLIVAQKAVKIAVRENKKIILVGAGRNIKPYLEYMVAMGMNSQIEAIVDNDEIVHGGQIFGIRICPVETQFETNIYLCTTSKKPFFDSQYSQIMKATKNQAIIIGYYDFPVVEE